MDRCQPPGGCVTVIEGLFELQEISSFRTTGPGPAFAIGDNLVLVSWTWTRTRTSLGHWCLLAIINIINQVVTFLLLMNRNILIQGNLSKFADGFAGEFFSRSCPLDLVPFRGAVDLRLTSYPADPSLVSRSSCGGSSCSREPRFSSPQSVFPGQQRHPISPKCPRSAPGSPPGWTCQGTPQGSI